MVASESVAIDASDFELMRDMLPGEAVFIDKQRPPPQPPERRPAQLYALHLRVRLFRATRFDHRQHLGLQVAVAHGRATRRQDPAGAPGPRHRRRDPDSRFRRTSALEVAHTARREVPRRLHQESLHRPHVHHAGQEIRRQSVRRKLNAIELEFTRQERAARGRLHRARHDVAADHRNGPRSRRPPRLLRVGLAAGPLPERLWHRHAGGEGTRRGGSHRRGSCRHHRRRLAVYQDLEDLVRAVRYDNGDINGFDTSCFSGATSPTT